MKPVSALFLLDGFLRRSRACGGGKSRERRKTLQGIAGHLGIIHTQVQPLAELRVKGLFVLEVGIDRILEVFLKELLKDRRAVTNDENQQGDGKECIPVLCLFHDDLGEDERRDILIGLGIKYLYVFTLPYKIRHLVQLDIRAVQRVVEPPARIFFEDDIIVHGFFTYDAAFIIRIVTLQQYIQDLLLIVYL